MSTMFSPLIRAKIRVYHVFSTGKGKDQVSTKFSPLRRACVPYQMHNNVDLKIPQPSPTGFHTPLFFFLQKTLPTIARTKPFSRPCLPLHVLHHSEDPAYHCTYYTIQQTLPTIARTTPFSRPCLPLHVLHHSADPAYHCMYYTIQQTLPTIARTTPFSRPCLPLHVLHHSAETLPTGLSILITVLFAKCCIALAEGGGGGGRGDTRRFNQAHYQT